MDLTDQDDAPLLSAGARSIDRLAARVPSDLFVWTGVAAAAASLGLLVAGKKQSSAVLGAWAPAFLALGLYSKLIKMSRAAGTYLH
jgi:hypothetical protein